MLNVGKKWVFAGINLVGKQFLHCTCAVFKRWQRNIVQHNQAYRFVVGAWAAVGRLQLRGVLPASVVPV